MLPSKPLGFSSSSSSLTSTDKLVRLLFQNMQGPEGLSLIQASGRLGLKAPQARRLIKSHRIAQKLKPEKEVPSSLQSAPSLPEIELSSDQSSSSGPKEIISILKCRKSPYGSDQTHEYEPDLLKYKAATPDAYNKNSPERSSQSTLRLISTPSQLSSDGEIYSRPHQITPPSIERNIVQSQAPLLRPKPVKPQARPEQQPTSLSGAKLQQAATVKLDSPQKNTTGHFLFNSYLQKLAQMRLAIRRSLAQITTRLLREYLGFKMMPDPRNQRTLLILIVLRSQLVKALATISSQIIQLLAGQNLSLPSQLFLGQ